MSREQSARELYLKQLADTYRQRQTDLTADYAARGLSQSGLLNEGIANLGKMRVAEQSSYETGYRGRIAALLEALTSGRADLKRQKGTIKDRYNQARADRARIEVVPLGVGFRWDLRNGLYGQGRQPTRARQAHPVSSD